MHLTNRNKLFMLFILLILLMVSTACASAKPVDLFAAVRSADLNLLETPLPAGTEINGRDTWGRTPLIVAVQQGNMKIVEKLIEKGADVNIRDNWGRTPLLVAVQFRNTSVAKLLIDKGTDVNLANRNEISPLITAAQVGNSELASILLSRSANLNHQDNLGWTALMWAASRNDGAMVKLLIEKKADVLKTGLDKSDALSIAKSCSADAGVIALLSSAITSGSTSGERPVDCEKEPAKAGNAPQYPLAKPIVDPTRIFKGPATAKITIIEYTDFQCPYCGFGAKAVEEVMARYEGQVKLVVKHFPLTIHPAAMPAALYFEALAKQSPEKAWVFYDKVFKEQRRLSEGEAFLKQVATDTGADMAKLDADLRSPENYGRIAADLKEVEQFQFDGVPVFVINGQVLMGAHPPEKFFEVIDALLRK